MCLLRAIILLNTIFVVFFCDVTIAAEHKNGDKVESYNTFTNVQVSPDGDRVTAIFKSERDNRSYVLTQDLQTKEIYNLINIDSEGVAINWLKWSSNNQLLLSLGHEVKIGRSYHYKTRIYALQYNGAGLKPRQVTSPLKFRRFKDSSAIVANVPLHQDRVVDFLPQDPEHILIALNIANTDQSGIYRLSVNNGTLNRVVRAKSKVNDWRVDRQHNARLAYRTNYQLGTQEIWQVEDRKLTDRLFSFAVGSAESVTVIGFDEDPNFVYFSRPLNDKLGIYKLNLESNKEQLMTSGYFDDVENELIYSSVTKETLGVRSTTNPTLVHYWKNNFNELQSEIDKKLPNRKNYLVNFSKKENHYIVYSKGNNGKGRYLVGNEESGHLTPLFAI